MAGRRRWTRRRERDLVESLRRGGFSAKVILWTGANDCDLDDDQAMRYSNEIVDIEHRGRASQTIVLGCADGTGLSEHSNDRYHPATGLPT